MLLHFLQINCTSKALCN